MKKERMEKKEMFMAVDQYGNTHHGLTHPRKELMEIINNHHASKMYIDKEDGRTVHVGYVIGGLWFTVYKVERLEREV